MLGFARVEREGDLAGEFKFNKKLKKLFSLSLSFFHLNQSDNQIASTHGTQASRNSKITAHRRSISKEKRARGVVPPKNFKPFSFDFESSSQRKKFGRESALRKKRKAMHDMYIYV